MGLFDNLFKKKNQRIAEETVQEEIQLREFEMHHQSFRAASVPYEQAHECLHPLSGN